MPTTNHTQSLLSSSIGRISINPMREQVTLNKIPKMTVKLTSVDQIKVIHQEIPSIQIDGYLTYFLYITIQNLIHLNAIHILLYHNIFWLNSKETKNEIIQFIENIENTEYEQTEFISLQHNHDNVNRPMVNVHLVNKYVYITLIGISIIELISTFIWTLQKKLTIFIQRYQKWRNRLRLLLITSIFILYLTFIAWIFYHTFITHDLTLFMFIVVLSHFMILLFLDKPNLICDRSIDLPSELFSTTNVTRKLPRNFSSSCSISSPMTINRFSYRLSTSTHSRKVNSVIKSLFLSSRWLSITEENFDRHQCSTSYSQIREEADQLWSIIVRRMGLKFYRTFASFIFFDLIPYIMMDPNIISTDTQRFKLLIIIFAINTFLTHSLYLFPMKFQANLHYLSNHLGQWRLKSFNPTDSIDEWSSKCNTYTYGNMIKLSSNYFIALQHIHNAAHPQSKSHSIIYRLFSNINYLITIQFFLCLILIFCQIIWIISGHFGFEIFLSILIILNSSYTIFKIIRNRLIFDMIDEHESDQFLLTSKQKKSN